jgi:hypothetical protein
VDSWISEIRPSGFYPWLKIRPFEDSRRSGSSCGSSHTPPVDDLTRYQNRDKGERHEGVEAGVPGVGALAFVLPAVASAQGTITGVVRDASGGVLPGVSVEAASPALIEKVRTAVTDGSGQYRIVDLRPGSYVVTFTLPGFRTVRREGIELTGNFVASVNGELAVGGLEETITVTGETPIVDVQSASKQQVIDKELADALPSSRTHFSLAALIPAINTNNPQDVGGSNAIQLVFLTVHGSRSADQRIVMEGMSTDNAAARRGRRGVR